MFKIKSFVLFIICLIWNFLNTQGQTFNRDARVMFYNVENLFDTINNKNTNDEEFLPESDKKWNSYKYWRKIRQVYQVIAAVGEERPPEIIGLCEVEDFQPLYDLVYNTPLMKFRYQIIHFNSPDKRGIDVALLVNRDYVKVLSEKPIGIYFENDSSKTTRDILYAKLFIQKDTLHVFVNHWPSRRYGQISSESYRLQASKTLQTAMDSIYLSNSQANVLVMGDFNDEPSNISLKNLKEQGLVNLTESYQAECKCGSYKYKNVWHLFDQMLVSEKILESKGIFYIPKSICVYSSELITENDNKYGGRKVKRTYMGPQYTGGFSDHLPVYLDLAIIPK